MMDIKDAVVNLPIISSFSARRFETTSEFIIYATVIEPERFRSYCEIVIGVDGSIILPINTGHVYIMQWLTGYTNNELKDLQYSKNYEIEFYEEWLHEKSHACSVWYNFQKICTSYIDDPIINQALDDLEKAKLIHKNIIPVRSFTEASEERKAFFGEK